MKKFLIMPLAASALLVACTTTTNSTTSSKKIVGTSPTFSGQVKLTEGMIAEGKTIFENSCAKCHDLPVPSKHSDEKWVGIMNAMAPKAKLTKEQSELVYNYVTFKN